MHHTPSNPEPPAKLAVVLGMCLAGWVAMFLFLYLAYRALGCIPSKL